MRRSGSNTNRCFSIQPASLGYTQDHGTVAAVLTVRLPEFPPVRHQVLPRRSQRTIRLVIAIMNAVMGAFCTLRGPLYDDSFL